MNTSEAYSPLYIMKPLEFDWIINKQLRKNEFR